MISARYAAALKGRQIQIDSRRPADGQVDYFTLNLHGGRYAWSDMLGHSACVETTVFLKPGNGQPGGPVTRTPCV